MAIAVFDMPVCNYAPRKLEESREERGQKARRAVRRCQGEAMAEVELRRPKGRAGTTRVEGRWKTADAEHAQEPQHENQGEDRDQNMGPTAP